MRYLRHATDHISLRLYFCPKDTCHTIFATMLPTQALQSRTPVGLEDISSVALMDRFDSKFLVPEDWLESVVAALSEHQVLTIQDEVTTQYNNLYFDTVDGRCFDDHVRGKNVRFKARIRHYDNTNVAFLEVKLRDVYGKTTKHRIVREATLPWNAPLTDSEVAFIGRHIEDTPVLKPSLQSSFERFTLVHLGSAERITFDRRLAYCHPKEPTPLEGDWTRATDHLAIVEWKQLRPNHQGALIQAFRSQPNRRGPLGREIRLSKFVLGNALLFPQRHVRGYRAALRDVSRAEHYAANPTFAPQHLLQ